MRSILVSLILVFTVAPAWADFDTAEQSSSLPKIEAQLSNFETIRQRQQSDAQDPILRACGRQIDLYHDCACLSEESDRYFSQYFNEKQDLKDRAFQRKREAILERKPSPDRSKALQDLDDSRSPRSQVRENGHHYRAVAPIVIRNMVREGVCQDTRHAALLFEQEACAAGDPECGCIGETFKREMKKSDKPYTSSMATTMKRKAEKSCRKAAGPIVLTSKTSERTEPVKAPALRKRHPTSALPNLRRP